MLFVQNIIIDYQLAFALIHTSSLSSSFITFEAGGVHRGIHFWLKACTVLNMSLCSVALDFTWPHMALRLLSLHTAEINKER